jgi:DNA-directed RNA polymerase subunit N (RpoN/RPB10)
MNCPTCGYFLGQINIEYDEKKSKICNNPQLSTEEKDKELSKLLLSLGLRRYCCKMRLMSYKDIVRDILPITNNQE